ncbi:esterase-like activity of phytase family protein [Frigidibacter sp. MR17.24]|uniref:esterase-like activity of phytase family protein n=1 Tax=Frigidibacter sp. MR17.24 TaxID=3127345 RepID=UPI0030130F82
MRLRPPLGLALVALPLLVAGCLHSNAAPAADGLPATFVGRHVWTSPDRALGGLSGIELSADGRSVVVLSDRGYVFSGTLERDAEGAVTGASVGPAMALMDLRGGAMSGKLSDSEGLALRDDGGFWVSFEQQARVMSYDRPGTRGRPGPVRPEFRRLEENGALEALAIDPQGRLVTLPEEPLPDETDTPVWRLEGNRWTAAFRITRDGRWKPVGADYGPDGRLYLLERAFWPPFGFQSRVRRFDPPVTATAPASPPLPGEAILESNVGEFDNLEGLAIWSDAEGAIRLTMIADDNFIALQRTELIDYRLPPGR